MKFFGILFILWIITGCRELTPAKITLHSYEILSCEEAAKPKSLQFLEQQYRCKSEG